MLKFGDVIFYEEHYYIFLAEKNDNYTYYFAKIISDQDVVRQCLQKKETTRPLPSTPVRQNNFSILTCFVILTTDDFDGQMAMLGKPDSHSPNLVNSAKIVGSINGDDIEEIKKEILASAHALPPSLVTTIKALSE